MSPRRWLLLTIAIAAASCGGAPSPPASSAPAAARAPSRPDPLEVIAGHVKQLRAWQFEIGPVPVPDGSAPLCAPAPPAGDCTDLCELTDHVCESASGICDQATELDGHGWADSKCSDARSMCRGARQACCTCGQPEASRPLVL